MSKILNFHKIFIENTYILAEKLSLEIVNDFKPNNGETYYIFGSHLHPDRLAIIQETINVKYIILQTEQINSQFFLNKFYLKLLQNPKNVVLNWSNELSRLLKKYDVVSKGLFEYQFLPQPINDVRDVDFFFCGSITPYRKALTDEIKKIYPDKVCIFDFNWAFEDNKKLTEMLLRTKYVLNIPYYKDNILETHRINKALSCGTIVLSEISYCEELNEKYRKYIHFGNIIKLVKSINKLPKKEKLKYDYILKI